MGSKRCCTVDAVECECGDGEHTEYTARVHDGVAVEFDGVDPFTTTRVCGCVQCGGAGSLTSQVCKVDRVAFGRDGIGIGRVE